jgi:hypothetical protein
MVVNHKIGRLMREHGLQPKMGLRLSYAIGYTSSPFPLIETRKRLG